MKAEQIRVTPTLRIENGRARKVGIARERITMNGKDVEVMVPDLDEKGKADPNKQERPSYIIVDGKAIQIGKHYKVGFPDALGKRIIEGAEFTYLDHFGPPVWYFYQLEDVLLDYVMLQRMATNLGLMSVDELTAEHIAAWFGVSTVWVSKDAGDHWQMKRFMPRSVHGTKDEALAAAEALKGDAE